MDALLRLLHASAAELIALALYAGIRVRDFPAARQWYERLLGDSSFLAHDRGRLDARRRAGSGERVAVR